MTASEILRRADILAKITDIPGTITRTYRSPAMQRANTQVAKWMRAAGLTVREDPAGNLIGRRPATHHSTTPPLHSLKTFILGSHLDTVRDAGKYDGILGILTAIAVAKKLTALPFHLEVYAFADEEGCRYSTSYLGSGAVTGLLTARDLKRKDANGVSLAEVFSCSRSVSFGGRRPEAHASATELLKACRRNPRDLLGYAEVHIEQGPVLDRRKLAVGVVKAIAGQTRAQVTFTGYAGHAGTTPMKMRRDALCAASEFVLTVEAQAKGGLVATVGMIDAKPGAGNVIPGMVTCSVDIRHENDAVRRRAIAALRRFKVRRGVKMTWESKSDAPAVACNTQFVKQMAKAAQKYQRIVPAFVSGAGHDAAAMAAITPVVMLFVCCKDGISHNPAESVREPDVAVAATVLLDFLTRL